jgi:hypothetical protein
MHVPEAEEVLYEDSIKYLPRLSITRDTFSYCCVRLSMIIINYLQPL